MPARNALELSHSALAGADTISVLELRERVRDRYPDAALIPDYPALDALLREAGYDWTWDAAARLYRAPRRADTSPTTYRPRAVTRLTTQEVPPAEREDDAIAHDTERKLALAAAQPACLILSAGMQEYHEAIDEITKRFAPCVIDLDRTLLDGMRQIAQTRNISWDRVLTADAESDDSRHRERLGDLIADAISGVEAAIRASARPVLLVNPGLLARYRQTAMVDRFRANPGPGVWLLVAGRDTHKPMIDSEPVPILSPNQWARVNTYWIKNRHRGVTE
jgi:hypothetical protein